MSKIFLWSAFILVLICQLAYGTSVGENGAKLRTGPGFDFPVNQELSNYQPLVIQEKRGEWYKVAYSFQKGRQLSGWAHKDAISDTNTMIVCGSRIGCVNLRSGPGNHYRKAANLYQGYLLELISKKGNWYEVKIVDPPENKTGWINNTLVWPK